MNESSGDTNVNIEWCHEILEDVSRTFALPIEMIEQPLSDYTCVGYLMCRISDTIEDSPDLDTQTKERMLDEYEVLVEELDEDSLNVFLDSVADNKPSNPIEPDHWELVENTDRVISAFKAFPEDARDSISPTVTEMIDGMRMFCLRYKDGVRIQTLDELETYCYYVAGTVGHMLARLASNRSDYPSEEIHESAEEYGLMLQMVNITKDIYGDFEEENNVYVPADVLEKYSVEQDELLEDKNIHKTSEVLDELIEETRDFVGGARRFVEIVSEGDEENLSSWALPYLLSIATLRELEDNSTQSLEQGGVKMDKTEVFQIISEAKTIDEDNFRELEDKISEYPLHKQ